MGRFILIVLDSVGVGALPDAADFGDEKANTLQHVYDYAGGLRLPNLQTLGFFNIDGLKLPKADYPKASYGRCAEISRAKDTITGHFEISGLIIEKPYQIFIDGFPHRIIDKFESAIGRKTIGNYLSSGTEIIQVLGDEHVLTGSPIVYVSADSLMQIAMHEEVIPIENQYRICQTAREILMGDDLVARVICRPFIGGNGRYTRTENRKDFAIDPPDKTVLNLLEENGKDVIAVGKIEDIFNRSGITKINHSKNNNEGIIATINYLKQDFDGLLFTNLVDFDMLFGHRNNAKGYGEALEYFDSCLPEILALMRDDDVMVITADHGCDPTIKGTDHTREYIPLLVVGEKLRKGINLGTRNSFNDIAASIADYFGFLWPNGISFLGELNTKTKHSLGRID